MAPSFYLIKLKSESADANGANVGSANIAFRAFAMPIF